jgi:drug/metabolite transporter (DMT)-like permease
MAGRRDPTVLAAFVGTTLVGGFNFVAVRLSNEELAPLWGAASRFLTAGLLLLAVGALVRWPFPKGHALTGTLLYGVLNFAAFYALMYWALLFTSAGFAAVAISLTPLLTLLFATIHGLERLTAPRVAGGFIALLGIAVVFSDQLSLDIPLLALLALLGAAAAGAESTVLLKRFPPAHPMTRNGIAMAIGGILLYGASRTVGEERVIPTESKTWLVFAYLVIIGSMLLFFLVLHIIAHWTASATSYAFVLFPVVAVAAGSLLAGETFTPLFMTGTALVIVGVYVAALRGRSGAPRGTPVPTSTPPKTT